MLWLLEGDDRVASVRHAIEAERTAVVVSAVTVWEAAIKSGLGKLRAPEDLPDRIDEFDFERLPVTDVHVWGVRTLPPVHKDPFDRLLAAQALAEQLTIVSADAVFDDYGVKRLW